LLVNQQLLVLTEKGCLVLAEPNTNAYTELGRFLAIPNYNGDTNKCWNAPAVADGRVYVRATSFGACFDLSVPGLRLDPPQPVPPNQFQLTIRTVDGSAIDPNRVATMQVQASATLALPLSTWPALTNPLVFDNGLVRVNNIDAGGATRRYFVVSEPR
jgi:hypothetical protein